MKKVVLLIDDDVEDHEFFRHGDRSKPVSLELGANGYFKKPNSAQGFQKIFKEAFN